MIANRQICLLVVVFFFFQAEDGIRDAQESRGLGDVYKRQSKVWGPQIAKLVPEGVQAVVYPPAGRNRVGRFYLCLLYTSDAADDLLCVDLGGRRIIKKKNKSYDKNLHCRTMSRGARRAGAHER